MESSGSTGGSTSKRQDENNALDPKSKRQRKGRSEGENLVVKSRKRKDLSLLHTMPFDVVYEVLGRLTMRDVVSVSRVGKEWCQLLSSRAMICLWKELRLGEGIPDPHPDISESSWAVFLLGGTDCEVCATKGIQAPDIGIRKRVCVRCKKTCLVPSKDLKSMFPQYDIEITRFLPYTMYNGSWMHSGAKENPYYWSDDIEEIGETWNKLQLDIRNGVSDARTKAGQYEKRRKSIVAAVEASIQPCMDWCKNSMSKRSETTHKRKEDIFTRLKALGYNDHDLRCIEWKSCVNQARDLTERIWKKIKPELESILQPHRRDRLVRECGRLFNPAYKAYITSVKPTARETLPTLQELFLGPAFELLLLLGDNPSQDDPIVSQIAGQLPELVSTWQEKSKTDLRERLLFRAKRFLQDGSGLKIDILDSAFAVSKCPGFWCKNHVDGVIVGWESAMHHRICERRFTPSLSCLDTIGNSLVANLIHLAGLDTATATWDEMDKSALRVFCNICRKNEGQQGSWKRDEVFTWRQAISHATSYLQSHNDWTVLNSNQLRCIWERHNNDCPRHRWWACNHCYHQPTNRYLLKEVKEHLKSHHNISKPLFPDDLFAILDVGPRDSDHSGFRLMLVTQDSPPPTGWIRHGRFVCNYCSHCTFETTELEDHIRDRHSELATFKEQEYLIRRYWQGWTPPPNFEYPPSWRSVD